MTGVAWGVQPSLLGDFLREPRKIDPIENAKITNMSVFTFAIAMAKENRPFAPILGEQRLSRGQGVPGAGHRQLGEGNSGPQGSLVRSGCRFYTLVLKILGLYFNLVKG